MRILSIDAGGTKTLSVLYNEEGIELERITYGPASIHVDFDLTLDNLLKCISNFHQVDEIVIGMSGAYSSSRTDEIKEKIKKIYNTNTHIISDVELGYYAHFGSQVGIEVISGTGSVILKRKNDTFEIFGGYGYILGDEGSGYSISKSIIKQALDELENQNNLDFVEKVFQILNVLNRNELITKFYELTRKEVASYSKELSSFEHILVHKVLKSEAEKLASTTVKALEKDINKIHLSGSVFNNEVFKDYYSKVLLSLSNIDVIFIDSNNENVFGGYQYLQF
jgi:N-acetylglucosamine kinase-like BadF-type ATPase